MNFGKTQGNFGNSIGDFVNHVFVNKSNGEDKINKLSIFFDKIDKNHKFTANNLIEKELFSHPSNVKNYLSMVDWQKRYESNEKPTILIDEIDEGLDLLNQMILFNNIIPLLVKDFQVILVSHSPFIIPLLKDENINKINFFTKKQTEFLIKNI
jgi:predicted ATPase